MRLLLSALSLSQSASLPYSHALFRSSTELAAVETPINENWWVPDDTEQDFSHSNGDGQSARPLEVTGFSRSRPVLQSTAYATEVHCSNDSNIQESSLTLESSKNMAANAEKKGNSESRLPTLNFEQAKEQILTAKSKVTKLKEELRTREARHESMLEELRGELKVQEENFRNRNMLLSQEFDQYKIQSNNEKLAIREEIEASEKAITKATDDRQNVLRSKIQSLESILAEKRKEVESAKMAAKSITVQRDELMKILDEIRDRYTEDSAEWESLLQQEQQSRAKEKDAKHKLMQQMMDGHNEKLRQVEVDARVTADAIRSDLRNRIFEKEKLLQQTEISLKLTELEERDLEERVNKLEKEKEDLMALGRQSIKVLRQEFLKAIRSAGK
mmetsp:Transcript_8106/g.12404  ORF Transcript_8106/g.12404 Transcript_8106/m.12404 type:complete len:388 (+) Transcript_8106:40-1203(+)